jgi:formylmethanofuran dehydrogenase subunit B
LVLLPTPDIRLPTHSLRIENNIACTVCGCVCDDLSLHLRGDHIERVERACSLAEPWFAALANAAPPAASIGDQVTTLDQALDIAADLLSRSHAPLIYGLSRSSTPGQRAAVELTEKLGATIDTTASICHGPSIMAIQEVGESTCTLGEVAQRADLVIFWGANPVVSHPRHIERYSLEPQSDLLPRGRADRRVIVFNDVPNETSAIADRFVAVSEGRDFELIWQLRELVRDEHAVLSPTPGVSGDQLRSLAHEFRHCRYGVVFFGLGLAQSKLGHLVVSGLLQLVADLNAQTRFTARRLRIPGDVAGADSVLCWQTGFPFAVNMGRGYPRYNPGEFSAQELLERGEVDSCVLIGSESLCDFSPAARAHLASIPTIVLEYPHIVPQIAGQVRFTTSVYGVHAAGTAYRMDETPIPLRQLCSSPYPTDETVLRGLLTRLWK